MNRTFRPNAYWLQGALPTVEQSKDEYIGSVYGAAVVVAQSLAHEAVEYVKRRAAKFTGYTIATHEGYRQSVSSNIASMSCAGIDFCLRNIARLLIEKHLPANADLGADPSVQTGLKAVLNVMADPGTWAYARDKADSFNKEKITECKNE